MLQVQSSSQRFSVGNVFSEAKAAYQAFQKLQLVGKFVLTKEQVLSQIDDNGKKLEGRAKAISDKLVQATEPNMPIEKFGLLIGDTMEEFKKAYIDYEAYLCVAVKPLGDLIDKSKAVMPEVIDQFRLSLLKDMDWKGLGEVSIEHGLDEVKGYFDNIGSAPRDEQERLVRKMNAAQADGLAHGQKEVTSMDEYSMLSQTLLIAKEAQEEENRKNAIRFMSAMSKQGQAGFKLLVEGVHEATAKLGIKWGFGDDYLPKHM